MSLEVDQYKIIKDAYSIRQKSSNPLFLFWPLNNIITRVIANEATELRSEVD